MHVCTYVGMYVCMYVCMSGCIVSRVESLDRLNLSGLTVEQSLP